jgi:putative Mg2+ transporter-C (MgtC) family protein
MTEDSSRTRVAGQVVTGIGFLCAGVLWHEGSSIRGLNTAATIWCTAAIGVLAGLDFPLIATIAALILVVANALLHWVEHRYFLNPAP